MEKITSATPEQWEEIEKVKQKWIDIQTVQSTKKDITAIIKVMWKELGYKKNPAIHVADSPFSCYNLYRENFDTPTSEIHQHIYWSIWWSSWAGWYEAATVLGVKFDPKQYDIFNRWVRHCPFIIGNEEWCCVSRKPIKIHWQDQVLHNEEGMSVEFKDGWGIYSIEGVAVDEQIVMRPDTQTMQQINSEQNLEIKRIRIDRYGWKQYLEENNAKVIDKRRNDIEATEEILFEVDHCNLLVPTCKTGRLFNLEVPKEITTCVEAQEWLHRDSTIDNLIPQKTRVIGRT